MVAAAMKMRQRRRHLAWAREVQDWLKVWGWIVVAPSKLYEIEGRYE
jgi:hypothetical protein